MAIIIMLIILLLIFILTYKQSTECLSNPSVLPLILVGVHGNEDGVVTYDFNYKNVIVANPWGVAHRKRNNQQGYDLNREWQSPWTHVNHLKAAVDRAPLIIDIHEGWSWHGCNAVSVGQTLYTNDSTLRPKLQDIIDKININYDDCKRWTLLSKLKPVGATLDRYCDSQKKPYILIEVAGQNTGWPVEYRHRDLRIILSNLL